MRLALIIIHLVFFWSVSLAQHCGFDHEYLLGVRPFSGDSSNVIEGLRITLVDEYQRPLEIQPSPECTQNKTTKLSYLGKPVSHSNHQYWFAPHDYVFVGFQSAWANSRAYVKIEDTKGLNNGHKFETQLLPFSQLNFIHLCGYSTDYEGKKFEKYRPIWVDLQRPPRIIRQDVLEKKPFIFVLDKNPENVHIDEAVGCYAARLSVYASWSNALLFDTLLQGIMNFESCQNIFYARDFNFDGYPDFRICVDGEKNAPYFLYDYPTVSFRQDSLLSSFQHILFDESRKSATGYGKLVPFQGSPYTYSQQIHEMRGEKLSWVKVESHLSGSPNWHAQVQAVDSFYYVDGKRKPFVSTSEGPTTVSIIINGWRVERKIEIYFAPETTEIKPLGYQPRKQSAAVYRIYRIFDEKLLLFASGEQYLDYQPEYVHAARMEDVDFDGIPDLWIPKQGGNKGYRYFGLIPQKDRFEELFISQLYDLEINKTTQTATGFRYVRSASHPNPSAKIHYVLRGKGLPVVKETREDLPIPKPEPKPFNPVLFSKTEGSFRYELQILDTSDHVKIPQEDGAYAQKVAIYSVADNQLVKKIYHFGNRFKENFHERKSLEIVYLNFDAVADIIIPAQMANMPGTVYLSCLNDGETDFYKDIHLSKALNYDFDRTNKTISGHYEEGEETFFFELRYLTEPLVFITRQNTIHPKTATRGIFRNSCGQLQTISGSLVEPIRQEPAQEFGDFNFDGYPDFRKGCDSAKVEMPCWEYYFFNPETKGYDYQKELENAVAITIDKEKKQISASFIERDFVEGRLRITTTQTIWKDGAWIPEKRSMCIQHTPNSERTDCTLEKFENGKWIVTKYQQGAE